MKKSKIGVSVIVACAGAAFAGGCADKMVQQTLPPSAGPCSNGGPCDPGSSMSGGAPIGGSFLPPGPQPTFRSTVIATVPPPPISGGTLLMTGDGSTVVAADPDRDALYVVDVAGMSVRSTIALKAGDEPGRLVEDGAGRVYVALRGGGAVVMIDPASGTQLARTAACPAPRGLAWDPISNNVMVACATGELVTLPAGGGAATRTLHIQRDLRDVIIQNGAVAVTTFRSAQVLRVAANGTVTRSDSLPSPDPTSLPHVAWRAVAAPSGNVIAVHQAESTQSLETQTPGGYGGGGGAVAGAPFPAFFDVDAGVLPALSGPFALETDAGVIFEGDSSLTPVPSFGSSSAVMSVLTAMSPMGGVVVNRAITGVLPVDVAVSTDGTVAGVTPGSAFTAGLSDFFVIPPGPGAPPQEGAGQEIDMSLGVDVQPIAVAFDANGRLLVQSREPAMLWAIPLSGGQIASVQLSAGSRDDTGHDVFHTQAGAQIACASCHPEGGDDGHTWILDSNQRRTPSLRGTIAGTAPYHWPGDQPDLTHLVNDVYTVRMSGARLPSDQMNSLTAWVQTIPQPPSPSWVDPKAVSLGQEVFRRNETACASCHAGPKFTNNTTVDVGTGGAFQVPPLIGVGWRTPLLHNGCAATIADRFGSSCATPAHGNITSLSPQDVANLTAYLETL